MKSLSALLIGGVISGGVALLAPFTDNEAPQAGSLETIETLLMDEESITQLELDLEDEGNRSVQIELQDSTLVTLLPNGKASTPDQNGEATADEDGPKPAAKPRSRVSGKIVIIDSQGHRKEYQFNGDQPRMLRATQREAIPEAKDGTEGDEKPEAQSPELLETTTEERFVLGVQCEDASELLRSHLKLGQKGLVVLDVRPETPAAEAGLRKNDILMGINGKDLENLEQLVTTVSGSDGSEVKLAILRAGEAQEIPVTPRKMKVPTMVVPASMGVDEIHSVLGNGTPEVRVRRIHPGLLIEGGVPGEQKDVEKIVEKIRRMAEASSPASGGESRITITTPGSGDVLQLKVPGETDEAVKTLQEQVKALQEQLSELQKKVQEKEADKAPEADPSA